MALVFCVFNNSYKLEPERFAIWMRILEQVPGSVLWLTPVAPESSETAARGRVSGVAGGRLVFARARSGKSRTSGAASPGRPVSGYGRLQRPHDSLRCAMGGTAGADLSGRNLRGPRRSQSADQRRTCRNRSRPTSKSYERAGAPSRPAGGKPEMLKQLRSKSWPPIEDLTAPLFDTARYVRNLERAYRAMWDLHAAGRYGATSVRICRLTLRPAGSGLS